MKPKPGSILRTIDHPDVLRKLDVHKLEQVCDELREFILDVVSVHPGHLGSSLGVVELTVALHYVYNTPDDRLIWDVGHQAYGHKILTGRRDNFHTNRQWKGISGFPKRAESEFDAFGTGHASTAISATLGMAVADKLKGHGGRKYVAVVGDGAMTGGLAMEGLNNAGASSADILVILNDNGISIDKNGGALNSYLSTMGHARSFTTVRNFLWKTLGRLSKAGPKAHRWTLRLEKSFLGSIIRQRNLFEALNFRYFGPVDGHDVQKLVSMLKEIRTVEGPKVLHVVTTKGKGFKKAEEEQTIYHAPGNFDRVTGELIRKHPSDSSISFQEVMGRTLLDMARKNDRIVAITPAMPTGSALTFMMEEFPQRVFDVGIAEEHAVTFSAGLAAEGVIPFCVIYSTFLQRAYDQVIHDVALQQLPVIFCIDRAGLVGEDGATHHGVFDLAFMAAIPNMVVSAPMDGPSLRNLMKTALEYKAGPFSIRYPRKKAQPFHWDDPVDTMETGKGRMLRNGHRVAVLSIGERGDMVRQLLEEMALEGYNAGHADMIFLKPLDEALVRKLMADYQILVTIEDGTLHGGLGEAVVRINQQAGSPVKVITLGIPDRFIDHGKLEELYNDSSISASHLDGVIRQAYIS